MSATAEPTAPRADDRPGRSKTVIAPIIWWSFAFQLVLHLLHDFLKMPWSVSLGITAMVYGVIVGWVSGKIRTMSITRYVVLVLSAASAACLVGYLFDTGDHWMHSTP